MPDPKHQLELAGEAFSRGDFGEVVRLTRSVLAARDGDTSDDATCDKIDALALQVTMYVQTGDYSLAQDRLDSMEAIAPGHDICRLAEVKLAHYRGAYERAQQCLERDPDAPELLGEFHYVRAMNADCRGDYELAEVLYQKAHSVSPDEYPLPVRMDDDESRDLIAGLYESLPPEIRNTMQNTIIDITMMPGPSDDIPPWSLGVYAGVPITEESSSNMSLPGRIQIFKRNIERIARDREHLIEELRITLLHEIGHHLGLDEDDLEIRGLG